MQAQTIENYLRAILELGAERERVGTSALAERLGIAASSASVMLKKLAELGLVVHAPYRGVDLTDAGRRLASEVIRRRRLIVLHLHHDLGVPWDAADAEADRWEHVLSADVLARIDQRLGHPLVDPPPLTDRGDAATRPPLDNVTPRVSATVSAVANDADQALCLPPPAEIQWAPAAGVSAEAPVDDAGDGQSGQVSIRPGRANAVRVGAPGIVAQDDGRLCGGLAK